MNHNIWILFLVILLSGGKVYAKLMQGGISCQEMKSEMMSRTTRDPMMQFALASTRDGGVVVLSANKLTEYDKSLNVVREVEMKPYYRMLGNSGMGSMMGNMDGSQGAVSSESGQESRQE